MPAISVIMPVHNGLPTLARAVASVRSQTLADWELLAVDDCSSDGSYQALLAYAAEDERIRVLRSGSARLDGQPPSPPAPLPRAGEGNG